MYIVPGKRFFLYFLYEILSLFPGHMNFLEVSGILEHYWKKSFPSCVYYFCLWSYYIDYISLMSYYIDCVHLVTAFVFYWITDCVSSAYEHMPMLWNAIYNNDNNYSCRRLLSFVLIIHGIEYLFVSTLCFQYFQLNYLCSGENQNPFSFLLRQKIWILNKWKIGNWMEN